MAERNSVPSSPKAGNRRESTDSYHTESLASNVEFMRLLRMLPDELRRLEHKIKKLERELNSSSSRVDSSSKKAEKFWKSRWENLEKDIERKQEEKILRIRNHYEQQLKNSTEVLQKNNNDLQKLLKESRDDASQKAEENKELKKELEKLERQLHEQTGTISKYVNHSQRFKQALEAKRTELNSFKERHAAFSERRVRSDQRKTENTLSRNRQSQLESEYVIDFKDGARVDAIDVMTTRAWRLRGTRSDSKDLYLKCCRFACFIFEIAYEVVAKTKDLFVNFARTTLKTLAADAPGIGRDIATFQHKLLTQQFNRLPTDDALSEVLILVKEQAKTHDLSLLVNDVKMYILTNWQRPRHLGLEYDSNLLDDLNDYIEYCTQFAWCALTQVPPLKIDHSTAVYNSDSHTVSQAFPRSPTGRPAYPEGQRIWCYLWPSLQDCDGKVIRKGEVVLYDYVYNSTYYKES